MIETLDTQQASSRNMLRENCQGILPLDARLAPWMAELLNADDVHDWVGTYGSPLNLIQTAPLQRNITALSEVAGARELDFRVYFARKANKCLAFVDAANEIDAGIDTASEVELQQVLQRGVDPSRIICTAAIKDRSLLQLCVDKQVTVAIDNEDELRLMHEICQGSDHSASIALRLSGFTHDGAKLDSRFGFDIDQCLQLVQQFWQDAKHPLKIDGIHFHLDGYCGRQRISAIQQSLQVIDQLRARGHQPEFLDIGGGFPMNYLDSVSQWNGFWQAHRQALQGDREPITFKNHGLGFIAINGQIHGQRNCYPYHQSPVQADWFAGVLDAACEGSTIAGAIQRRGLQLRSEPGRSILDGCGMTAARVQYRKQHPGGDWLIGLSMNGTQCRTSSDDFLVDPIVIPCERTASGGPITGNTTCPPKGQTPVETTPSTSDEFIEGYLVGAYCMESELLLLRKLRFRSDIRIGDLVVFPNTAGYLMHFMESRSHQFPLAKNLIITTDGSPAALDNIEQT